MAWLKARRATEYRTLASMENPHPIALVVKTSAGGPAGSTRATRNAGMHRAPRPAKASTACGSPDPVTACTATQSQAGVTADRTLGLLNRYPLSPATSQCDCVDASCRSLPGVPCPAANSAPRAASSSIHLADKSPARYASAAAPVQYRCALTASAVCGAWRASRR
jgi:hypothetical protein